MDYWQTGTGIEQIAAELVASQYHYGAEQGVPRAARRPPGQARRIVVGTLVALATWLDPALSLAQQEAAATVAANPAT